LGCAPERLFVGHAPEQVPCPRRGALRAERDPGPSAGTPGAVEVKELDPTRVGLRPADQLDELSVQRLAEPGDLGVLVPGQRGALHAVAVDAGHGERAARGPEPQAGAVAAGAGA